MNKPLALQHPLDGAAITLSGLCLVHCLALPVAAGFLPLLARWAEAEWVHLAFAALALPVTGLALWRTHRRAPLPGALLAMAGGGLALLLAGAMGWPAHALETPLTVAGALLLAATHLCNLRRHPHGGCARPGQAAPVGRDPGPPA